MWHFERVAQLNAASAVTPPGYNLPVGVSRSGGGGGKRAKSGAEPRKNRNPAETFVKFLPLVWLRPGGRDAGWARWATAKRAAEARGGSTPSHSSVVSQLTSRGTWRHLVPVWMTVTVEGRGRAGSSAAAGSSGSGELRLYDLAAEGKAAMEGPAGGEKGERRL